MAETRLRRKMMNSILDFKFEVSIQHYTRAARLAVRYECGGVRAGDTK